MDWQLAMTSIAYLVTDQQDSIYIYDLVGGTYLPAIANPWTSSEVFCGGTWIYEIGGGCNLFEDTFDSDIAQWTEVGGLGVPTGFGEQETKLAERLLEN